MSRDALSLFTIFASLFAPELFRVLGDPTNKYLAVAVYTNSLSLATNLKSKRGAVTFKGFRILCTL